MKWLTKRRRDVPPAISGGLGTLGWKDVLQSRHRSRVDYEPGARLSGPFFHPKLFRRTKVNVKALGRREKTRDNHRQETNVMAADAVVFRRHLCGTRAWELLLPCLMPQNLLTNTLIDHLGRLSILRARQCCLLSSCRTRTAGRLSTGPRKLRQKATSSCPLRSSCRLPTGPRGPRQRDTCSCRFRSSGRLPTGPRRPHRSETFAYRARWPYHHY